MSSPLPEGLDAIERLLEASVVKPAPGLRERVLSAARAQENVRPLQPASRSLWLAATAAAAVLFLFNAVRSASLDAPRAHRPSRALCASLLREPHGSNPFAQSLIDACPPAPPSSIEE